MPLLLDPWVIFVPLPPVSAPRLTLPLRLRSSNVAVLEPRSNSIVELPVLPLPPPSLKRKMPLLVPIENEPLKFAMDELLPPKVNVRTAATF